MYLWDSKTWEYNCQRLVNLTKQFTYRPSNAKDNAYINTLNRLMAYIKPAINASK